MLDTSVAIALRDGDDQVLDRLRSETDLLLSSISLVELEGGVQTDPQQTNRRRDRLDAMLETLHVVAFEEEAAVRYGRIVAELGFSRSRIIDRMIAAHAIQAGIMLLTLNTRDFRDIPQLRLADWRT